MPAVCERCGGPLRTSDSSCPACGAALAASGDNLLGRALAGRYRIVRLISRGGTAQIHEAIRIGDGRRVAVKSLRPDREGDSVSLVRILREARATMRIHHPNVVELLDVGELEDGQVYLVLEYVDGPTLLSLLANGPLEPRRALAIAGQIADALVAVHREGVVHRDLTPRNVVVLTTSGREVVKLVDFGIAAMAFTVSITGPENVLGTPGYMAPEYVRDGHADARSDQYSLGVLAYEMLCGRLPFDGTSPGKLLVMQAKEPPIALRERMPTLGVELERVVMRAIEHDPARRFPNIATFAAALAALGEAS